MSQGFCIHAYNNLEIDYGTMSLCSALLIKKNCKINSVTLITSIDTVNRLEKIHSKSLIDTAFDNVIVIDVDRNVDKRRYFDTRYSNKTQPYYNKNRVDTYKLSPYDETILLDSDYLVLDNSFDYVWGVHEDILANKQVVDLKYKTNMVGLDLRFNDMSIPLYWATSLYFRKTERAETLFKLIDFIKNNYQFYQDLYQFSPSGYFRNDYALSIAIHMMDGQLELDSVKPFPNPSIMVATEYDDLINFKDNKAYFISEEPQGQFNIHKIYTNIHVMNKWSINRNAERIISYATTK